VESIKELGGASPILWSKNVQGGFETNCILILNIFVLFSCLGFCGLPIEPFLYFYKHVYIKDQNFPLFGHINFLQSESFCPMLPPYVEALVLIMVALF